MVISNRCVFVWLLFLALLWTADASAQVRELWHTRYDAPAYSKDLPAAIALDRDGGIFVSGQSIASERFATVSGSVTVKYDTSGREVWVTRGPESSVATALSSAGSLFVAGSIYVDGDVAATLVRYDADGGEVW